MASASFLTIYWPALFAMSTMVLQLGLDPSPASIAGWPPQFDLSGKQAVKVVTSPYWLAVVVPVFLGLLILRSWVKSKSISGQDHASMVWWLLNLFWFHIGCDVLSGYFQVMPVLTELYQRMNPAHDQPRWSEARNHLDSAYVLEALVEVPLCAWCLLLFARQDQGRYIAEVFALAVQFTGTVNYYVPGIVKLEAATWLSHLDRLCGSAWLIYPAIICYRTLSTARGHGTNKAKDKKK
eukprot:TRINITY_DN19653_c2_g1_i1.p1 TRINITY_DN19653_c2_g1~~TRINITY_DN19653_c2_g1_i1.p1  ORF type:complete len:238 (+),score=41.21 TRINITY_DN19653_c2_g1_i1:67-780(+)